MSVSKTLQYLMPYIHLLSIYPVHVLFPPLIKTSLPKIRVGHRWVMIVIYLYSHYHSHRIHV